MALTTGVYGFGEKQFGLPRRTQIRNSKWRISVERSSPGLLTKTIISDMRPDPELTVYLEVDSATHPAENFQIGDQPD